MQDNSENFAEKLVEEIKEEQKEWDAQAFKNTFYPELRALQNPEPLPSSDEYGFKFTYLRPSVQILDIQTAEQIVEEQK